VRKVGIECKSETPEVLSVHGFGGNAFCNALETPMTFSFPSAPGSQATWTARNRLETAILGYGDSMRTLGALVTSGTRAMQERHTEARWDEVERLLDEMEGEDLA
jgi:hypothetical protein